MASGAKRFSGGVSGSYDLVIIGAGVMGLSCAYELSQNSNLKLACVDMGADFSSPTPLPSFSSHSLTTNTQLAIQPAKGFATDENFPPLFHPSASYNAAGILASNGVSSKASFRSNLRRLLITSVLSYPKWFAEINQILTASDMGGELELISVKDYHFYDLSNEVHRSRFDSLLKRLEYEGSDFESSKSLDCGVDFKGNGQQITFSDNHIIRPRSVLKALVEITKSKGVDFYWNSVVEKIEDNSGKVRDKIIFLKQNKKDKTLYQEIKAKKILLTTGWYFNALNTLECLKKYSLRMKFDAGFIKIFPESEALADKVISRPGGKNYFINDSKWGLALAEIEDCTTTKLLLKAYGVNEAGGLKNTARPFSCQFGLRPVSVDKKPIVGCLDEKKDWWVASGHHKMGWSLAPLTAKYLCGQILGEPSEMLGEEREVGELMATFTPLRFGG